MDPVIIIYLIALYTQHKSINVVSRAQLREHKYLFPTCVLHYTAAVTIPEETCERVCPANCTKLPRSFTASEKKILHLIKHDKDTKRGSKFGPHISVGSFFESLSGITNHKHPSHSKWFTHQSPYYGMSATFSIYLIFISYKKDIKLEAGFSFSHDLCFSFQFFSFPS